MGRDRGRDEDNLLELKCLANFFRTSEVTQMDGVDGAPEQPNPAAFSFRFFRHLQVLRNPVKFQIPISKSQTAPHPSPLPRGERDGVRGLEFRLLKYCLLFDPWCSSFGALFSYLSFSVYDKFSRRQFLQPHGAEGVEFG